MKEQFVVNIFRLCAFLVLPRHAHFVFFLATSTLCSDETKEATSNTKLRKLHIQVAAGTCKAIRLINLVTTCYENCLAYIDETSMEPTNLNGQSTNWMPSLHYHRRNRQLLNSMPIVNTIIQMIIKLFPKSRLYLNKKISCNQKGFHTLMELTRSGYIVVKNSWLIPKDEIYISHYVVMVTTETPIFMINFG